MPQFLLLSDDYDRDQVEKVFGDIIQATTGLERSLVRPLWQPDMPAQPSINADWCAFGIEEEQPVYTPIVVHDGINSADMSTIVFFNLYTVFYGANGFKLCSRLRDSLFLTLNRETLYTMGIKLKNTSAIKRIPELVNNRWYDRCDMRIYLTRSIRRSTSGYATIIDGSVQISSN